MRTRSRSTRGMSQTRTHLLHELPEGTGGEANEADHGREEEASHRDRYSHCCAIKSRDSARRGAQWNTSEMHIFIFFLTLRAIGWSRLSGRGSSATNKHTYGTVVYVPVLVFFHDWKYIYLYVFLEP